MRTPVGALQDLRRARPWRALLFLAVLLSGCVAWATAPTDVKVPVPHMDDGGGMLCYFGSLGMIAKQQQPELTYQEVLRHSDLGSLFAEPEDMAEVARSLGFRVHAGGLRGLPGFLDEGQVAERRTVADRAQAMAALEDVLHLGRGALVCIELTPLTETRKALGVFGPFQGGHMVVVRGLTPEGVLIQDPQYEAPVGDDILLETRTFMDAWEGGGFGLIHLEPEEEPEAARLEKSLDGLEGSPAKLRWLADFLTTTEPVPDGIMHLMGGNSTRRRALAAWLKESGEEGAARLLEVAAERYRKVNPMEQRDLRTTLLGLAQIETQALRQLGREPLPEVDWSEMIVLGPRFFDRGKEPLTIRPGEGIGPLRLGALASECVPRDWRLGPTGPYQRKDVRLRYRSYPDQGLLVVTDDADRVVLLETRSSRHRLDGEAGPDAKHVRVGSPARGLSRSLFGGAASEGPRGQGRAHLNFRDKGLALHVVDSKIGNIEVFPPYPRD